MISNKLAGGNILPSPAELRRILPASEHGLRTVSEGRATVRAVLEGRDPRLLAILGPCSVHKVDEAREYARRLARLAQEVGDTLYLIMRVYIEKPRTVDGWKGLIHDPGLDGSCQIDAGLVLARRLLLDLAELGVPTATEVLDPVITPVYLSDLIAWSAIGARTVESQVHRELASGLPMPVGFKNSVSGCVDAAINAVLAARKPHRCMGLCPDGHVIVAQHAGNAYA